MLHGKSKRLAQRKQYLTVYKLQTETKTLQDTRTTRTQLRLWSMYKLNANELQLIEVFKRKILRKIFGSVQTDNSEKRIRFNHELEKLINGHNIRRFVKAQRLK